METNQQILEKLAELNIHVFLKLYGIKNENGLPIDFYDHRYLADFYEDFSPKLCMLKAAQVGASTAEIIKSAWMVRNYGKEYADKIRHGLNAIYTLPTQADRNSFVSDKVNRIIAQNPIFQSWTKDKDSVEQKQLGDRMIHFRGTFTEKAAMMVSSDINFYDEIDASDQSVVEQYSTRLQHSNFQGEHYFSHPSAPGFGIDRVWNISDQKHWFVRCRGCSFEWYLRFPESIDPVKKCYICTKCGKEITNDDRRNGRWVRKYKNREFSGYWVPLLICPWVPASDILKYREDKGDEYFFNKVLGLPYVGKGNKLTQQALMSNLTSKVITPLDSERAVLGIDTGKHLHFVMGTEVGLFHYGEIKPSEDNQFDPWIDMYKLMDRFPKLIAVVDQGGDLIGTRKFRERYVGRVFLCAYGEDRKTQELVRWGKKDEYGTVIVDRNRTIQLVVDEFTEKRIPIQGTENDWLEYWSHWNNLTRMIEENERGVVRRTWVRSGDDHYAHATVYWRAGMMRFSSTGTIIRVGDNNIKKAPEILEGGIIEMDPLEDQFNEPEDWRN